MEKTTIFLISIFFLSCTNPTTPEPEIITETVTEVVTETETVTVTETETEYITEYVEIEVEVPPEEPQPTQPIMASYDGVTVKTYDGTNWHEYATGTAHNIGSGWISVYDTCYNTQTGETYKLSCTPDYILLSGTDFYYTASGSVYKNRDQINDFGLIPADDIREFKTGIYILHDRWWKHVETGVSFFYTVGDNLAVADTDIYIFNSEVPDGPYPWVSYAQSAYEWVYHEGIYYSDNGAIYEPGVKFQNGLTPLYGFTPDGGTYWDGWTTAVIPYCIGKYTSDSVDYIVYLDLNNGHVYQFSPELNTMDQSGPIIDGYGTDTLARNAGRDFWHIQVSGKMYFPFDGSVYEYDPSSGAVNVFLSGDYELWDLK